MQLEEWDKNRGIPWRVSATSILARVKIYQIKRFNLAISENRFSLCFITSLPSILTAKHKINSNWLKNLRMTWRVVKTQL